MARSGSVDYSLTGTNIIRDALFLCEGLEEGESLTTEHTNTALRALNAMVKAWQADGQHRWALTEGILFLDGSQSYQLGPNSTDHAAKDSYVQTRLDGSASSGATSLTVDSTTGMSASDNIGVELSDGTRDWQTISSVDSGTTLTLNSCLSGAASDNATVFVYTTAVERPVRVVDARRKTFGGQDVEVWLVTRDQYFRQPNKDTQSQPTMTYYSPQLDDGVLYIWPTGSISDVLKFTYERPLQDFDSETNNPDVPQEWFEALTWNLAVRLAPQYRTPMQKYAQLKQMADQMRAEVLAFDENPNSLFMVPGPVWSGYSTHR